MPEAPRQRPRSPVYSSNSIMYAYLAELEAEERRHQRISAIITAAVMILLLLFSLLWTAWRQTVPPPGEEYEVLGAIDFGNYESGSRQVNNFEPPTPDPAETPPPAPPEPQEEVQESLPEPIPDPVETQPEPSPVTVPESVPDPKPKPEPVKPTPPKPKPQPQPEKPQPEQPAETTSSQSSETPSNQPTDKPAGSNQGNESSGTGNQGTPSAKVLDPQGLYSFGTGTGGGLQGRSPLDLPYPKYNVQEEGDIQFQFVIGPDGRVLYVKPVGVVRQLGLKDAGIDAIKRWRFSALPPGQSGNQTVRVTIKFRLK